MDLPYAHTLLQRINRVFDDFGEGGTPPSALELDLLREYVRRFYESLSDDTAANYRKGGRPKSIDEQEGGRETPRPQPKPTRRPLSGRRLREPATSPTPTVAFDVPTVATASATAQPPNPISRPEPTTSPALAPTVAAPPAPAILHVPETVEADVRQIESAAPTPSHQALARGPQAVKDAVPQVEPSGRPKSETPAQLEPALHELFSRERGTDLGDRLGNAPVADLTRAMALNQRLVVQNQLFGKDASSLKDALTDLNGKDSYEEAVSSLATLARKYDWTEEERRPAARDFVKLVQRRYPSA